MIKYLLVRRPIDIWDIKQQRWVNYPFKHLIEISHKVIIPNKESKDIALNLLSLGLSIEEVQDYFKE